MKTGGFAGGAVLAVLSLLIQSVSSLALLLVMARLLPAQDFTAFSLGMTIAQFSSALGFEWLRLSALRFYPGPADGRESIRLASLRLATLLVVITLWGGLFALGTMAGYSMSLSAIVGAIAILQGASDMRQTILRLDGHLHAFSLAQISRTIAIFSCGLLAARMIPGVDAALIGVMIGYVAHEAGMAFLLPRSRKTSMRGGDWTELTQFARYGLPAAIASILHYGTVLGWRSATLRAMAGQHAATAAFSLAIDLFQKPFPLLGTLIGMVVTPSLVRAYDRGTASEQKFWFGTVVTTLASFTLLGGALLNLLAPVIAMLFIPVDYRTQFLAMAPAVILAFALHFTLQTTIALVPQLRKTTYISTILAAVQLAITSICLWMIEGRGATPATSSAVISATTGVLAGIGIVMQHRQLRRIDLPVTAGALLIAAGLAVQEATFALSPLVNLAVGILVILGFCGLHGTRIRQAYSSTDGSRP